MGSGGAAGRSRVAAQHPLESDATFEDSLYVQKVLDTARESDRQRKREGVEVG